jgi:hypothetical protein
LPATEHVIMTNRLSNLNFNTDPGDSMNYAIMGSGKAGQALAKAFARLCTGKARELAEGGLLVQAQGKT